MTDDRPLEAVPAPTALGPQESWTPPPGLDFLSTPKQRLEALLALGFTVAQLRAEEVLDCSDQSLRNWLDGRSTPRGKSTRILEDLRATIVALDAVGVRGENALKWLYARHFDRWMGGLRPIDLLAPDPLRLLAAVQDLLYPEHERPAFVMDLQLQPVVTHDADEAEAETDADRPGLKVRPINTVGRRRRRPLETAKV